MRRSKKIPFANKVKFAIIVDGDCESWYLQMLKRNEKLINVDLKPEIPIIINNPCLEFWFLLHFESTSKFFNNCEEANKQLKKYLPDYKKSSKYFTKQDNDIYIKLKPKLKNAISNANRLKDFDLDNPYSAITQMQLLFETSELGSIINALNSVFVL
jgi:hypothetical protein